MTLSHFSPDFIGHNQCLLHLDIFNQYQKFIAAKPSEKMLLRQSQAHALRYTAQHFIAGIVTEIIVDSFEIINSNFAGH